MKSNIADYLEEMAKRFPKKTAFADEKREITFQELRDGAARIATGLLEEKCFRQPVVVYMDKSVEAVEAIYGIISGGCYFTPIDIKMPLERVEKILDSLKPVMILTDAKRYDKIRPLAGDIPCRKPEEFQEKAVEEAPLEKRRRMIIDTDLLYILFTSGSTGMPKGVMISHRAVMDFMHAVVDRFGMDEKEKLGNQGQLFFDLSVLDLYAPVFCGATTYLIPQKYFKFPVKLLEYIAEREVTMIYWVPSALVVTANLRALEVVSLPSLKKITFCGEIMPCKQLNVWRRHLPDALYVNMYGPTETCCASTYYIVDRELEDDESLPIGKAFDNTRVMILDDDGKEAAPGEQGELCIGGSSLAYGYLNNPEKTAESFVTEKGSPWGEKIYRTGDLVRLNEKGELMYLSRKDFQIKHMGHRIELGEIETALNSLEDVTECCCMYDDANKKIVAFLEQKQDEKELKRRLSSLIPDYMIPGRYIFLKGMPHNANGKIDRALLKSSLEENKKTGL